MKQIKFRGKDIETGEWVYGNLYQGITDGKQYSIILNDVGYYLAPQDDKKLAIAFAENDVNVVFTQTVGQFTEYLDKNENEIYEGDILVWGENDYKSPPMIVMFKHGSFGYTYIEDWFHSFAGNTNFTFNPLNTDVRFEIVGNIHDNPEILKK